MTIYAWKRDVNNEIMTVIPGADTIAEMTSWQNKNVKEDVDNAHINNVRITEPIEHLFEDDLSEFKRPLVIYTHNTQADRDAFFDLMEFEEVHSSKAIDIQNTMIWIQKEEEQAAQDVKDNENGIRRTIGEITGTNKNDPWDTVPEEIAVMSTPKGVTGHGAGAHGGEGKIKDGKENKNTDTDVDAADDDHVDSVMIRNTKVDNLGNVHVDIAVLDESEQEQIRKMRKEAKEEKNAKEQEIREKAAKVGIDADLPDTYTALEANDIIIQQNNRLQISETVLSNGHRIYRDLETGVGILEKDVERLRKKREAAAQIRDIEAEEEREREEAEEAERKAEEEKSDLRKKLDKLRSRTTEQPKQEIDPAVRGEELMAEINKELENGFSSRVCASILQDLSNNNLIEDDFATSVAGDFVENESDFTNPTTERKIRRNLLEANDIFKNLSNKKDGISINTNRQQKTQSKKMGDDYYFAVIPPGEANTDETTSILGQEAFIVLMPKKGFDNEGKVPGKDGGWFTEEELEEWETKTNISVEEIAPSIYKMDCNIGDAVRHFKTTGVTEDGRLIIALGIDIENIPFDWPYHYKKNGRRITENEMRIKALRILQIAREQGIMLKDEQGEITGEVRGIDQGAIAKTEQDITAEIKKTLGATGTTEDSQKDCDLITSKVTQVKIGDLPSDVYTIVTGNWYHLGDDHIVNVITPSTLPFLRVDGNDLFILPEEEFDIHSRIYIEGTTNLQKVKKISVSGPSATVYKKVDSNKPAYAIYCYLEQYDKPWIVLL